MRRILANRPVLALAAIFTVIGATVLHGNPFGAEGEIAWPAAILIAAAGNLALCLLLVPPAAPYLASSGGKEGAASADPRAVATAERWTAGVLMAVGVLALVAVGFATSEIVITPSQRLDRNAELVRENVLADAPPEFERMLTASRTWEAGANSFRSCVPAPDEQSYWCVRTSGTDTKLDVTESGLVTDIRALIERDTGATGGLGSVSEEELR